MSEEFTKRDFQSINVKADSQFSSFTDDKIELVGLDEDVYGLLLNVVPIVEDAELKDNFGDRDITIQGNLVSVLITLNRNAYNKNGDIYVKTLYSFLEAMERKRHGKYKIIQRNYGQDKNELNSLDDVIKRMNIARRERQEYYK